MNGFGPHKVAILYNNDAQIARGDPQDLLAIQCTIAATRNIHEALTNQGLQVVQIPVTDSLEDLKGRLVAMFIKCEPNRDARLRGRRQVMFNDSDIPYHRHAKAAVGGAVTAAIGDPAVFISVDAMHSGPHGSGPCVAVVDVGP